MNYNSNSYFAEFIAICELVKLGMSFEDAKKAIGNEDRRKAFIDSIYAEEDARFLDLCNHGELKTT
jgi:hypothetical protein